jgi:SAM-dependent methyltransferase
MREKLERLRDLVDELIREIDGPQSHITIVDPPEAFIKVESKQGGAQEEAKFPSAPDWPEVERLLASEEWPDAVFAAQITDENSERDKEDRAEGIAEILLPPMLGKKFLDFGCGEGHVVKHVAKEASVSVGYDIVRPDRSQLEWENKEGPFLLTTDIQKAKNSGPYDVILLYDVIDHAEGLSASELLSRAAELLTEDGKIFVRCHPWCGRHGGHLYRKINKAFVHLVLNDDEMRFRGINPEHNIKVTKPLYAYSEAIKASGLVQESEPEVDSQEVESFFKENPAIADRILRHWGASEWDNDPPAFQMSQCFVDYVLKKG